LKSIFTLILSLSISFNYAQTCIPEPKVLLAGDSWAQYMYDDGTHNEIFNKFGHPDYDLLGQSLGSNPGAGYAGTEYAISGSEAREWADMVNYPWIDNVINEITNNPSIETVILSIGGNDILAAKSDGGWYKDMDLDVPGSEAALFATIRANTFTIINEIIAVHPNVDILLSSYDYPNFNTGFLCFAYACPKRRDLSRDPNNDLITDAELNQMMVTIEEERISWLNLEPKLFYDNAVGLSHYYYGDGVSAPGVLALPEQQPPFTSNFNGGNINRPSIRPNFRNAADPIHLNANAYRYKIIHQTMNYFMPKIRTDVTTTFFSNGNAQDGWTNGATIGTNAVRVGDDGSASYKGILSFDTSALPDDAIVEKASIYLIRNTANTANPFTSGALGTPQLEVKTGSFGALNLEISDFTEIADVVDAGCFHGTVSSNGYALRIDLNASGMAAVNLNGTTQFRISFPNVDVNADYVAFNTGDAVVDSDLLTVGLAEYMNNAKPFMDVEYSQTLSVDTFKVDDIKLYPNPVKNNFYIKGLNKIAYNLEIMTVDGRIVKQIPNVTSNKSISTEGLENGFYLVRLSSGSQSTTIKFLKSN
jgi:hypothetical protein